MKTISYCRFSTPPQEYGNSAKRQLDMAQDWCKRNNLTLDDTYLDKGKSAWHGKHRDGALGELLNILESGDILLVEDEDRLSRENPLTALNHLRAIVERGIDIVTLRDGRRITKTNFFDLSNFLPSIIKATLANEENEKKSKRLKTAWAERRNKIAKGIPSMGRYPFWMTQQANGRFVLNEKAEVIRRIFDLSIRGYGVRKIAQELKGEYAQSSIQYILKSHTTYGAFQSRQKVNGRHVNLGEITEDILPAVITKNIWLTAQNKTKTRKTFKGRYDGTNINNLFTGLNVCSVCGGSMLFTKKGKHSYLTCSAFHLKGTCKPGVLNYNVIEAAILSFIKSRSSFAFGRYLLFAESLKQDDKSKELESVKHSLTILQAKISKAADYLLEPDAPVSLIDKLRELESQQTQLKKSIQTLEEAVNDGNNLPQATDDLIKEVLRPTDRMVLRERLRTLIDKIVVNIKDKSFDVVWKGRRTDRFSLSYQFNGCKKAVWKYRVEIGEPKSKQTAPTEWTTLTM